MKGRAARLAPVVKARRIADQARLAACLAEQRRLRARAAEMMAALRRQPPGGDAADMALTARWQAHMRDAARAMLAEAAGMEDAVGALRARLALSLGREKAVEALAAAERDKRQQRDARRAEHVRPDGGRIPGQPSPSGPPLPSVGASSVGIA